MPGPSLRTTTCHLDGGVHADNRPAGRVVRDSLSVGGREHHEGSPSRDLRGSPDWGPLLLTLGVAVVLILELLVPSVAFMAFLAVPIMLLAFVRPPGTTVAVALIWLALASGIEWWQGLLTPESWVRIGALTGVIAVAGVVARWREQVLADEAALRSQLTVARDDARAEEQLLQAVSDSILDPLVFLRPMRDMQGEITDFAYVQVNDAMCEYLGKRREDVLATTLLASTPGVRESGLFAAYVHSLSTGEPLAMNDVPYFNEILGVLRHYDIRANRTHDGLSLTWRDVTERVEAARAMASLAQTDPLTGLLNRAEALHRMESARGHRRHPGTYVAAIFCDIDQFKDINDRYGHHAGDRVLQEVASRVQASVRDGDIVARFGGDEILVLLDGVHGLADAQTVANVIHGRMADPIPVNGESVGVTLSIGLAVTDTLSDIAGLIARADAAMYNAKRVRHRVIVLSDATARTTATTE